MRHADFRWYAVAVEASGVLLAARAAVTAARAAGAIGAGAVGAVFLGLLYADGSHPWPTT
jgi:hypothetical protein